MSRFIKFSFLVVIFACQFLDGYAQTPSNNKGKAVNWTAINGKNNEFALYIPEGYVTGGAADYYMGRPRTGVYIDKQVIVARYINGVILLMEYYDGGGKQVQQMFEGREKLTLDKTEEINGFQVKSYSGKVEKRFHKTQHFLIKNRFYMIKSVAAAENDPIVKAFFESVRLTNQDKTIAPNAAAGATTTSLPPLVESDTEKFDNSKVYSLAGVDRKPLVPKAKNPPFPAEARRTSTTGMVKMKVLFSADGKITDVEVLESPSQILAEASIRTVKDTLFIPAEKDGKLVSVYNIITHSFDIY